MSTNKLGQSMDQMVDNSSNHSSCIKKSDLQSGDWVIVTTQNSIYYFSVLGDGLYLVSGGIFDRKGLSPLRTTIAGCTWGGTAIRADIVAAYGMSLEFGNYIVTSPIKEFHWIQCGARN